MTNDQKLEKILKTCKREFSLIKEPVANIEQSIKEFIEDEAERSRLMKRFEDCESFVRLQFYPSDSETPYAIYGSLEQVLDKALDILNV